MGQLPEYDRHTQEAVKGAIARQPDPLPRGAVVAGVARDPAEGAAELPPVWFCPDCGGAVTWSSAIADLAAAKSDLRAAQERIRSLEEDLAYGWEACEIAVRKLNTLEAILSRLRPVVRAAKKPPSSRHLGELVRALGVLTPEDRAWAEGSP